MDKISVYSLALSWLFAGSITFIAAFKTDC